METFFSELFQYNHHHNQKIAQVFLDNPEKTSERSVTHLLNAHHIWNSRISAGPSSYGIWKVHPMGELKVIDQTNFKASLQVLQEKELESLIHYNNSKGEAFTNSIRDILFHIINHSTYHRGQIASQFRQIGLEPVVTDFVFYKRQCRFKNFSRKLSVSIDPTSTFSGMATASGTFFLFLRHII